MSTAIYAIRNTINNKMYIGSSKSCSKRWSLHKRMLNRNIHHSKHLQSAYNKYGSKYFEYSVIEYVEDVSLLIKREQVWMDFFKPSYNSRPIANSPLGTKRSEETKAKMSAAHKGKVRSHEHCLNISKSKKGVPMSIQQKELLSKINKGKSPTLETRKKLAQAMIGNKRAAGKIYTDKEKKAISEQMKKIWLNRKLQKDLENV